MVPYNIDEVIVVTGRPEEDKEEILEMIEETSVEVDEVYCCDLTWENSYERWEKADEWKVEKIAELDPDIVLDNEKEIIEGVKEKGIPGILVKDERIQEEKEEMKK